MTREELLIRLEGIVATAVAAKMASERFTDDDPSELEERIADIEGYIMEINGYLTLLREAARPEFSQ
jgi:hypothetical protein